MKRELPTIPYGARVLVHDHNDPNRPVRLGNTVESFRTQWGDRGYTVRRDCGCAIHCLDIVVLVLKDGIDETRITSRGGTC